MPHKRLRKADAVEQDFLDALERLKARRPQNPELREKVRKGKQIKINVATVAKEAGRARGLIALEKCRYPKVRQLILAEAGVPGAEPRNCNDVIADLRAQVAELRVALLSARDHAAHHLDLRTKAERHAAEYKGRYERLRKRMETHLKHGQGKIVALFPEDDERQES